MLRWCGPPAGPPNGSRREDIDSRSHMRGAGTRNACPAFTLGRARPDADRQGRRTRGSILTRERALAANCERSSSYFSVGKPAATHSLYPPFIEETLV